MWGLMGHFKFQGANPSSCKPRNIPIHGYNTWAIIRRLREGRWLVPDARACSVRAEATGPMCTTLTTAAIGMGGGLV